ncbi:arginine--tRNA ligase [Candidatus Peregrinibacteria bacterium]|nr:arginine--tRNA ligase [Candidatus Peregrinibacteria bacterium]
MTRDIFTASARGVLKDNFGIQDAQILWSCPKESAFGDLTTNAALSYAKAAGKSPKDIADAIVRNLEQLDSVAKAEVAGNGYVNVWLTPQALIDQLGETLTACTPAVKRSRERPVIVEYSQPNIAKPLGAHHLLTTLIGQAIANMYEHAGYPVVKWNYIGDWGTQFGKLAVAVQKWGDGRKASAYSIDELLSLYVRFHEEVEKDTTLEDAGREAFRRLEAGDRELTSFWKDIVTLTKESLSGIYGLLHVSFDLDLGESFYQDKMEPILRQGIKGGVFVEGKEGALIVEFPEATGMPPYLVRKGDGATLYSTRDIAQMRYRMDTYNPQEILIVTDIAQKLHFEQLVATCERLGWKLPVFENVLSGRMRFADKSMSTRKGNVLKLEQVLSEAVERAERKIADHGDTIQTDDRRDLAQMMGIGAVAYGILSQSRKQDIVFDWDKMLSFDGNSAPYLQYTHARARSVLDKAGKTASSKDIRALTEKERSLINMLLKFSATLEESRSTHMPHILANYLYALCQEFNAFYNVEPILKAEEPQRSLRLSLTELTAQVLKTGASLLTISVPDRM